jgi:hypothetical protein
MHFFLLQALILLQVLGWVFLPVFIASGVSFLKNNLYQTEGLDGALSVISVA